MNTDLHCVERSFPDMGVVQNVLITRLLRVHICRNEGDIAMETCPSYGVNTTKPTVQDQVYEECDTEAYEKLY